MLATVSSCCLSADLIAKMKTKLSAEERIKIADALREAEHTRYTGAFGSISLPISCALARRCYNVLISAPRNQKIAEPRLAPSVRAGYECSRDPRACTRTRSLQTAHST